MVDGELGARYGVSGSAGDVTAGRYTLPDGPGWLDVLATLNAGVLY